jgi:hypothetical protein
MRLDCCDSRPADPNQHLREGLILLLSSQQSRRVERKRFPTRLLIEHPPGTLPMVCHVLHRLHIQGLNYRGRFAGCFAARRTGRQPDISCRQLTNALRAAGSRRWPRRVSTTPRSTAACLLRDDCGPLLSSINWHFRPRPSSWHFTRAVRNRRRNVSSSFVVAERFRNEKE